MGKMTKYLLIDIINNAINNKEQVSTDNTKYINKVKEDIVELLKDCDPVFMHYHRIYGLSVQQLIESLCITGLRYVDSDDEYSNLIHAFKESLKKAIPQITKESPKPFNRDTLNSYNMNKYDNKLINELRKQFMVMTDVIEGVPDKVWNDYIDDVIKIVLSTMDVYKEAVDKKLATNYDKLGELCITVLLSCVNIISINTSKHHNDVVDEMILLAVSEVYDAVVRKDEKKKFKTFMSVLTQETINITMNKQIQ